MSEIKNDIQESQPTEESIKSHKDDVDKRVKNLKGIPEKQKVISLDQRVDETFWDLDWKSFKEWDIIKFMYMGVDWKKSDCSFNIDNQVINKNWETYDIKLKQWANLDSVEFKWWGVVMKWSVWWFSWEWKVSTVELYNALWKAFKNWSNKMVSKEGDVTEINRRT